MASARFEPTNLGTKGQHATPRPPKPLNVGLGLALLGPVPSDPVWRGPVQVFMCKFKMTSHI